MDIFGVGTSEMLWIAVLAVLLFGERLPEVARMVARISRQLREATREFRDALRLDD
ncbi:MAG: twin-arginine translocase TatA/TatE family subunit [Armatimonadetes bacterium]|nr:twin-arginine translocase TatA/TatE family subunit [Armatimonadota bacterium]